MWASVQMFCVSGRGRGKLSQEDGRPAVRTLVSSILLGVCPWPDLGWEMASPTVGESDHGNTGLPQLPSLGRVD